MISEDNQLDTQMGRAFTAAQLEDVAIANGNMARFVTELMGTKNGQDALIMSRVNNIGNFNPLSHNLKKWFANHGIASAAIHTFVDTYVTYGVNFAYMMFPFSRTASYIAMTKGKNITNGDLVPGGYVGGPSKQWWQGFRMNLLFDAGLLGHNVLVAGLIYSALEALGFDPPENGEDKKNISAWRIGSKVGWGRDLNDDGTADGIEIQIAWWLNDLTMLGLPGGYAMAAYSKTKDKSLATDLFLDGLMDQFDGNFILDVMGMIKDGGKTFEEMDQMATNPDYVPEGKDAGWGIEDNLREIGYYALAQITGKPMPFNWLYRSSRRMTILFGDDHREVTTSRIFDTSSEGAKAEGRTKYNEDIADRQLRRYTAGSFLLGLASNLVLGGFDDNNTGYWHWQMPVRTRSDDLASVMSAKFFNYNYNDEEWLDENGEYMSQKAIDAVKVEEFLEFLDENYDNDYTAYIRDGGFIPNSFKYRISNYCFSNINYLKAELNEIQNSGEYAYVKRNGEIAQNSVFWQEVKPGYDEKIDKWYNLENSFGIGNKKIPSWYEPYEQIVSDYDTRYRFKDTGEPATKFDYYNPFNFFSGKVEEDTYLKGNHPNQLWPVTWVDEKGTGWDAETIPYWVQYDSDGNMVVDLDRVINIWGDETIPYGPNKGMLLKDVLQGRLYSDIDDITKISKPLTEEEARDIENVARLHPGLPDIGERSWVVKDREEPIPEEWAKISLATADGSVLGEKGMGEEYKKEHPDEAEADADSSKDDDSDNNPNKTNDITKNLNSPLDNGYPSRGYPSGSSGGYSNKSYYRGSGSGGGSNYNPKIYSYSKTINADRPATMYSKTPYATQVRSYLRPGFETKGSREAYKRGDF